MTAEERTVPGAAEQRVQTYLNCVWSEARILTDAPGWLTCWRSRWCCLALSDRAGAAVDVHVGRCATCKLWMQRPGIELESENQST